MVAWCVPKSSLGCLLAWRSRALPRPLCALGMVALVYPLVVVLGLVLEGIEEGLWILGIGSLVLGLPAWFASCGVWAIVTAGRSRVATGQLTVNCSGSE